MALKDYKKGYILKIFRIFSGCISGKFSGYPGSFPYIREIFRIFSGRSDPGPSGPDPEPEKIRKIIILSKKG